MPLIRKNAEPAAPVAPPDLETERLALRQGDAQERWRAARALLSMPGGATVAGAALAGESDVRVREVIFTGLARSPTVEGVEILLALLRSDDVGLRTGALDAMRAMPELTAVRLPALLSDPDPDVRLAVVRAGARIIRRRGDTPYVRTIGTRGPAERCAAASATSWREMESRRHCR